MYLLYLDESGNEDDPTDRYFILAGLAIFERSAFFLSRDFDDVQTRHFPGAPPIAFHASAIRSGRGFWRNVEAAKRTLILSDLTAVVAKTPPNNVALFAAAIEKSGSLYGEEAVELATAEVCRRFDTFLTRKYREEHDGQRGLIIFSEGRFHQRAKVWVKRFRELGTKWGVIRNLADIPYFASTEETRLLQAADLVAHATFLLYERRDPVLIRPLLTRFHQQNGTLHGLVHQRPDSRTPCDCPACHSRRAPADHGPWLSPKGPEVDLPKAAN